MSEDQKKQLERQLWNIADTLRGKMNADEFRDYILGFIFYKYLSEKMNMYADSLLESDGIKYTDINENTDAGKEYLKAVREESITHLGYFLKPSELFGAIARRGNSSEENGESNFILEDLAKILNNIEQSTMGTESEDDFDNLFEDLDLTSTKLGRSEAEKNRVISKVLAHLDKIDFHLADSSRDVLGDAYEYLIGQFASGAGKKAGEFYTPQQVSKVLAKIVTTGKTKLKTVYDPTCGSGSLLLRVAREVSDVGKFYGQELNRTTYNLARMNMILHGVHYQEFDIKQEDSLEHPQHFGLRAEAVVANPPFSAQWSANPLHLGDDRFSQYGKLAPSSKADFAFIQHMIHHLADNGIMAVVAPHGVLFRASAEGNIRQYLIEDRNYLDAVIGLPANIFYGTGISTCILVFKKCRENPDNILFIDASQNFEKSGNQNYLRHADIELIINTYRDRTTLEKYSYVAKLEEIRENGYNLNIKRYVDSFETDDIIDLNSLTLDLKRIEEASKENDKIIFKFCEELKLPNPLGNNISLLKAYKKGLMQKIFDQEIRFKDNNGNSFANWQEIKLGETIEFLSDYTANGSFASLKENVKYYSTPNYAALVRTTDLEKKKFIPERFTDKKGYDFLKKTSLFGGEIILANVGNIGQVYKVPTYSGFMTLAPNTYVIKFISTINAEFIFQYMKTRKFKNDLLSIVGGGGLMAINKSNLRSIKIKIPTSFLEQEQIGNFLSAIDKKIYLVDQEK